MISKSDFSVEDAQRIFVNRGIEVAFLVPTQTGLKKSIMDATFTLRVLLELNGIHSYDLQEQGPQYKKIVSAYLILSDQVINLRASLYRPRTKSGDPRIWFSGLKKYCIAGNLLAIFTDKTSIYIVNLSNNEVHNSIKSKEFVHEKIMEVSRVINSDLNIVADNLLKKLTLINQRGFHKSDIVGDTAVGMTLEKLLGISPNSSTDPDYEGIEIKATRLNSRSKNRVVLFSQTPNWEKSELKSGLEVLKKYGYVRNGIMQLYCTISASKPNAQKLYLELDKDSNELHNKAVVDGKSVNVVLWDFETLKRRLTGKHKATFWVKAISRKIGGVEEFLYTDVTYTQSPSVVSFIQLLESSHITLDYTLKHRGNTVRDHGYLFKIHKENFDLLFPPSTNYELGSKQ